MLQISRHNSAEKLVMASPAISCNLPILPHILHKPFPPSWSLSSCCCCCFFWWYKYINENQLTVPCLPLNSVIPFFYSPNPSVRRIEAVNFRILNQRFSTSSFLAYNNLCRKEFTPCPLPAINLPTNRRCPQLY